MREREDKEKRQREGVKKTPKKLKSKIFIRKSMKQNEK